MKYFGMPCGMWILFKGSFQRNLNTVLGIDNRNAVKITAQAKRKYKEIIDMLPEFEKGDIFKMNLVNCALFASFCLNMEKIPPLTQIMDYYTKSMMTLPMRWFCQMSGKQKFSSMDIKNMKAVAALRPADRNPYFCNYIDFVRAGKAAAARQIVGRGNKEFQKRNGKHYAGKCKEQCR